MLQQPRLVADASRPHQLARRMSPVVSIRPVDLDATKGMRSENRLIEDQTLRDALRVSLQETHTRDVAEASASLVAWNRENPPAASDRDVPADSVADVMEQIRRHQSLFSYGDR
jgi:hypothetical protein